MNDGTQMTTPVLQDWWERYVCPTCMSKHRETIGSCGDAWHAVPAVTYECTGCAFSPLSIPVAELQQGGLLESRFLGKYGQVWTRSAMQPRPRRALGFV